VPHPKSAIVFPTEQAFRKYMKEHPGADYTNHSYMPAKPKAPKVDKKRGIPVKVLALGEKHGLKDSDMHRMKHFLESRIWKLQSYSPDILRRQLAYELEERDKDAVGGQRGTWKQTADRIRKIPAEDVVSMLKAWQEVQDWERSKRASSQATWALLTEGVTRARLESHRMRHMVNRILKLIEDSKEREHLYQVAGDVIEGFPERHDKLDIALDRTALALAMMGEEFLDARLPLSDKRMVEEAVSSAFGRPRSLESTLESRVAARYLKIRSRN